jgi:PAS domain S-box-containing protein
MTSAPAEEIQTLEILNRLGVVVAAEIDLETVVQVVTDAATELSGAAFGAFFYNVSDEKGETYSLYALSGAPKSAFSSFPMPRNTGVFGPTFRNEGIVRSADITVDPRYGKNDPYFGMPEGHLPVRSYLAVSVLSRSSEVIGGLFFGHPDAGRFSERSERVVAALAVQAGIAMDKARLYRIAQDEIERRKVVEAALRDSEEALEAKVAERTAQLVASNESLIREAEEREKVEGRFRLLVDGVTDYAIYMLDPHGFITNWNTGAQRIKGYGSAEIVGQNFSRFFTEGDREAGLPARALGIAAREGKYEAEGWRVRKNGSHFWASVVVDAIRDAEGELLGFAKITRDITERREALLTLQRTQEQLAQAQKMEGIGHLTGGVAHDFNNLLAIIMGNIETLQRTLASPNPDTGRLTHSADNAMRGTQRAVALTQRLLAFSRQQPLEPKVLSASRLVGGMSDLLRRSLGEQIVIETVLAGGLWQVLIDPNQLEVAILNLAINARDAMPEGGSLSIETANVFLDEAYASGQVEVVPGEYVVISVTDTGCGMSADTASRVFEPFFTTKDVGHGTGLGLSQVYGFVKQSGGHVRIDSAVGEGTCVKIYLPRLHAAAATGDAPEMGQAAARSRSAETILVVEDEDDVRAQTCDMLRELGYRTLDAGTGADGLRVLQAHPEVRMLFTDVGLPGGMNGRQLADEAKSRHSGLKVLFTTGYARDAIVHGGRVDPDVQLITKPFTYVALASRIRDILDAGSGPARILLVEDEPLIQMVVVDLLEAAGYNVDAVGSASEAMNRLAQMKDDIGAAVVDIGLPDRNGDVLVDDIRAMHPALPIVIASGHAETTLRSRFSDDSRMAFLIKPYRAEQLRAALAALNVPAR